MALINADTKLCDIIINDPSIITVLNRFGITLGVGDATVAHVCNEKQIDQEFFTTILNTYINEEYFPEKALASFKASDIVSYLEKTNAYYEHVQLPNIERHFMFLTRQGEGNNGNLNLMLKFFLEVKHELLGRIAYDHNNWFPEVIAHEKNSPINANVEINNCSDSTDVIQDKIDDLISMLVIHLKGDFDQNLGVAVLHAIVSLRKDINQNNRIRQRILMPLSTALKNNCCS